MPVVTFHCQRRDETLDNFSCHDKFVDAHGFHKPADPCYLCPRGAAVRMMLQREDLRSGDSFKPSNEDVAWCLHETKPVRAERLPGTKGPGKGYKLKELEARVKAETWWGGEVRVG